MRLHERGFTSHRVLLSCSPGSNSVEHCTTRALLRRSGICFVVVFSTCRFPCVVSIYPGLPLSEMKTVVNTRVTEVQPLKMKAGACSFLAFCTQSLKERTAKTNNIPLKAAFEEESRMLDAKGIIFDIDGTLADSWKLGFDATQVILEKHGIPLITEETYHECTRNATPDRLARHAGLLPGEAGYEE